MKKFKFLALFFFITLMICLSACDTSVKKDEADDDVADTSTTTTSVTSDSDFQAVNINYPIVLEYSSGVGAWVSTITINEDGTFVGEYHDQEMGDRGDEFPNGTRFYSLFSGNFTDIKQIDDYTFSLTVENITTEQEWGYTNVEDGVRYIATYPAGLVEYVDEEAVIVRDYLLYLPGMKTDGLPEEFLTWSAQYAEDKNETLSGYALMNTKTYDGFF